MSNRWAKVAAACIVLGVLVLAYWVLAYWVLAYWVLAYWVLAYWLVSSSAALEDLIGGEALESKIEALD